MVLNCPYVIFGEETEVITQLQAIRQKHALPTMYSYRNLTRDMYPHFEKYQSNWVGIDIPSKEVAIIWCVVKSSRFFLLYFLTSYCCNHFNNNNIQHT